MSLTTRDKQDVRQMIKDGIETSPIILRMESAINRLEVSYDDIGTKVNRLEEFAKDAKIEIYKMGVLIEDNNSRLQTVTEAIDKHLKLSAKVDKPEFRLRDIESIQPLIIKTLALHSKQLRTQG